MAVGPAHLQPRCHRPPPLSPALGVPRCACLYIPAAGQGPPGSSLGFLRGSQRAFPGGRGVRCFAPVLLEGGAWVAISCREHAACGGRHCVPGAHVGDWGGGSRGCARAAVARVALSVPTRGAAACCCAWWCAGVVAAVSPDPARLQAEGVALLSSAGGQRAGPPWTACRWWWWGVSRFAAFGVAGPRGPLSLSLGLLVVRAAASSQPNGCFHQVALPLGASLLPPLVKVLPPQHLHQHLTQLCRELHEARHGLEQDLVVLLLRRAHPFPGKATGGGPGAMRLRAPCAVTSIAPGGPAGWGAVGWGCARVRRSAGALSGSFLLLAGGGLCGLFVVGRPGLLGLPVPRVLPRLSPFLSPRTCWGPGWPGVGMDVSIREKRGGAFRPLLLRLVRALRPLSGPLFPRVPGPKERVAPHLVGFWAGRRATPPSP